MAYTRNPEGRTYGASPEDGGVALHRLLHLEPQLGGRHGAVGEAEVVQVVDGGLSGVGGQRGELLSWKNEIR